MRPKKAHFPDPTPVHRQGARKHHSSLVTKLQLIDRARSAPVQKLNVMVKQGHKLVFPERTIQEKQRALIARLTNEFLAQHEDE